MVSYLEKVLIQRCRNGDSDAFASLLELYKKQLFTYLLRRNGNVETAEDLFQETAIKMWKNIKKYKDKKKFGSWLFSIAHNVSIDEFRKSKVRSEINNSIDGVEITDQNQIIKSFETIEEISILNNSLSKLSDIQREVFLLRQHGELTFREISELLNQPLNTVLSHMNYAVKKLKRILRNENAE